jgi:hypothetical protein
MKARIRYSTETLRKAEEAFWILAKEYDPVGRVIMPMDICRYSGISRDCMYHILHDAPWWDDTRNQSMLSESHRRGSAAMATLGYPNLVPLKQHTESIFRKVEEAFFILAKEYDPNGKTVTVKDISKKSAVPIYTVRKVLRNVSWWDIDRKHAATEDKKVINREIIINAGRHWTVQQHLHPGLKRTKINHAMTIKGNHTRMRILDALAILPPQCTQQQIADCIGVTDSLVCRSLRILRAQGLIDEHNRPIQQDTAHRGPLLYW